MFQKAFKEQLRYELKLHENKQNLSRKAKQNWKRNFSRGNEAQQVEAQFPKIVISKFEGDYMDWQCFWGAIKKSGLASIKKFSYL